MTHVEESTELFVLSVPYRLPLHHISWFDICPRDLVKICTNSLSEHNFVDVNTLLK